jgi:hypothetical protein
MGPPAAWRVAGEPDALAAPPTAAAAIAPPMKSRLVTVRGSRFSAIVWAPSYASEPIAFSRRVPEGRREQVGLLTNRNE